MDSADGSDQDAEEEDGEEHDDGKWRGGPIMLGLDIILERCRSSHGWRCSRSGSARIAMGTEMTPWYEPRTNRPITCSGGEFQM